MKSSGAKKGTLVTGVIGEDVHIVGIRVIEHALRNEGYNIVALGAQVPLEEFVSAAVENRADAILVSSLSGHAGILVPEMRNKCTEAGLKNIRLYLGGNLVIGEQEWQDVEKKFKDMGFNRVYAPGVDVEEVIRDLEADV